MQCCPQNVSRVPKGFIHDHNKVLRGHKTASYNSGAKSTFQRRKMHESCRRNYALRLGLRGVNNYNAAGNRYGVGELRGNSRIVTAP